MFDFIKVLSVCLIIFSLSASVSLAGDETNPLYLRLKPPSPVFLKMGRDTYVSWGLGRCHNGTLTQKEDGSFVIRLSIDMRTIEFSDKNEYEISKKGLLDIYEAPWMLLEIRGSSDNISVKNDWRGKVSSPSAVGTLRRTEAGSLGKRSPPRDILSHELEFDIDLGQHDIELSGARKVLFTSRARVRIKPRVKPLGLKVEKLLLPVAKRRGEAAFHLLVFFGLGFS